MNARTRRRFRRIAAGVSKSIAPALPQCLAFGLTGGGGGVSPPPVSKANLDGVRKAPLQPASAAVESRSFWYAMREHRRIFRALEKFQETATWRAYLAGVERPRNSRRAFSWGSAPEHFDQHQLRARRRVIIADRKMRWAEREMAFLESRLNWQIHQATKIPPRPAVCIPPPKEPLVVRARPKGTAPFVLPSALRPTKKPAADPPPAPYKPKKCVLCTKFLPKSMGENGHKACKCQYTKRGAAKFAAWKEKQRPTFFGASVRM